MDRSEEVKIKLICAKIITESTQNDQFISIIDDILSDKANDKTLSAFISGWKGFFNKFSEKSYNYVNQILLYIPGKGDYENNIEDFQKLKDIDHFFELKREYYDKYNGDKVLKPIFDEYFKDFPKRVQLYFALKSAADIIEKFFPPEEEQQQVVVEISQNDFISFPPDTFEIILPIELIDNRKLQKPTLKPVTKQYPALRKDPIINSSSVPALDCEREKHLILFIYKKFKILRKNS